MQKRKNNTVQQNLSFLNVQERKCQFLIQLDALIPNLQFVFYVDVKFLEKSQLFRAKIAFLMLFDGLLCGHAGPDPELVPIAAKSITQATGRCQYRT